MNYEKDSFGHNYDISYLEEYEDAEFDHSYMDEDLEPDDNSMFPRIVPVENDEESLDDEEIE